MFSFTNPLKWTQHDIKIYFNRYINIRKVTFAIITGMMYHPNTSYLIKGAIIMLQAEDYRSHGNDITPGTHCWFFTWENKKYKTIKTKVNTYFFVFSSIVKIIFKKTFKLKKVQVVIITDCVHFNCIYQAIKLSLQVGWENGIFRSKCYFFVVRQNQVLLSARENFVDDFEKKMRCYGERNLLTESNCAGNALGSFHVNSRKAPSRPYSVFMNDARHTHRSQMDTGNCQSQK